MPLSLKDAEFAVQAARSADLPVTARRLLESSGRRARAASGDRAGGCPPLPGGAAASLRRYGAQRYVAHRRAEPDKGAICFGFMAGCHVRATKSQELEKTSSLAPMILSGLYQDSLIRTGGPIRAFRWT